MPNAADRPDTVVLLTALDLEYDAVREHLTDLRLCHHRMGTLFEVGNLPDTPWQVALAVTGAGNQRAAALAERAITMFEPVALFMVGVAGSLRTDVALGDVIVATRIHNYQGGKDDDGGFHARPSGSNAPHWLEQIARYVARTRSWAAGSSERSTGPSVHFRPIVAGDVVLNSRDTPLARQIRHNYNDAAAIEMESAGATAAAELNQSLPVLTIRGISDKADGDKHASDEAGWQQIAAANAASFAVAVIAEVAPATALRRPPTGSAAADRQADSSTGTTTTGTPVIGYHERPSQHEKALLVDAAIEEVIDLGTALNTCSNYLVTTERPARYRRAVLELLDRGGRYRCFLLDPDSPAARNMAVQRNENLPDKIRRSLDRFGRFKASNMPGVDRLEIHLTRSFAGLAALAIDLGHPHAALLYSPYVTRVGDSVEQVERGDMPHFLLTPSAGPLFTTTAEVVRSACADAGRAWS